MEVITTGNEQCSTTTSRSSGVIVENTDKLMDFPSGALLFGQAQFREGGQLSIKTDIGEVDTVDLPTHFSTIEKNWQVGQIVTYEKEYWQYREGPLGGYLQSWKYNVRIGDETGLEWVLKATVST